MADRDAAMLPRGSAIFAVGGKLFESRSD